LIGLLALLGGGFFPGTAYAPEFTYIPPAQTAYWAPPPEYEGAGQSWEPPPGYEKTSQPWAPPQGWDKPLNEWEKPRQW